MGAVVSRKSRRAADDGHLRITTNSTSSSRSRRFWSRRKKSRKTERLFAVSPPPPQPASSMAPASNGWPAADCPDTAPIERSPSPTASSCSATSEKDSLRILDNPNMWFYIDSKGVEQGPFSTQQMKYWHERRFLPRDLKARQASSPVFAPLAEIFPGDWNDEQPTPPAKPATVAPASSDLSSASDSPSPSPRSRAPPLHKSPSLTTPTSASSSPDRSASHCLSPAASPRLHHQQPAASHSLSHCQPTLSSLSDAQPALSSLSDAQPASDDHQQAAVLDRPDHQQAALSAQPTLGDRQQALSNARPTSDDQQASDKQETALPSPADQSSRSAVSPPTAVSIAPSSLATPPLPAVVQWPSAAAVDVSRPVAVCQLPPLALPSSLQPVSSNRTGSPPAVPPPLPLLREHVAAAGHRSTPIDSADVDQLRAELLQWLSRQPTDFQASRAPVNTTSPGLFPSASSPSLVTSAPSSSPSPFVSQTNNPSSPSPFVSQPTSQSTPLFTSQSTLLFTSQITHQSPSSSSSSMFSAVTESPAPVGQENADPDLDNFFKTVAIIDTKDRAPVLIAKPNRPPPPTPPAPGAASASLPNLVRPVLPRRAAPPRPAPLALSSD